MQTTKRSFELILGVLPLQSIFLVWKPLKSTQHPWIWVVRHKNRPNRSSHSKVMVNYSQDCDIEELSIPKNQDRQKAKKKDSDPAGSPKLSIIFDHISHFFKRIEIRTRSSKKDSDPGSPILWSRSITRLILLHLWASLLRYIRPSRKVSYKSVCV